ncbi:hypothetical protein EVAR_7948_1 [Eumeta japonica]|uniref:Uncharacterized protein n=1 Tax=Eumeta variegata TaxID=151549 RepID=A0A4C1TJE8_EUMVA|nr:hypothetical protein EVAR_7948_1 [Eumeta japonica]
MMMKSAAFVNAPNSIGTTEAQEKRTVEGLKFKPPVLVHRCDDNILDKCAMNVLFEAQSQWNEWILIETHWSILPWSTSNPVSIAASPTYIIPQSFHFIRGDLGHKLLAQLEMGSGVRPNSYKCPHAHVRLDTDPPLTHLLISSSHPMFAGWL